jgi:[protein-PII] uridylyltransferase
MLNPLSAMQTVTHTLQALDMSAQQRRERRREWLYYHLGFAALAGITADEIEAHFKGMPARYWDTATETEILWGLRTIHRFLHELASPESSGTAPVLDTRHFPEEGVTELMLCTWDRHGLLAKVAGALSALGINILQADVYTRADAIVLDVFRVCEREGSHINSTSRLEEIRFLIEGALSEPPRFASLWACSRHKHLSHVPGGAPTIRFDITSSFESTVVIVEAADRLGLLHDILAGLTEAAVNVCHAVINTRSGMAHDSFYLTTKDGEKITDPTALEAIRCRIAASILS